MGDSFAVLSVCSSSSSTPWLSSHTRRLSLTILFPFQTCFKWLSRRTVASRTVVLFAEPRLCPTSNPAFWPSSFAMLIPACSSSTQALSKFAATIPRNFTRIHLGSISAFHHRASRSSRCWRAQGSSWPLAHCRAFSSSSAVILRRADPPLNAATNSSIRAASFTPRSSWRFLASGQASLQTSSR